MERKIVFPFVRIVGQEPMKKALVLNIVDPGIGGVLVKGEKGTAKSTAVRSLEGIMPRKTVNEGCPFRCETSRPDDACPECKDMIAAGNPPKGIDAPMRVVELPLSATGDRVTGTLDIEHILKTGERKFDPGILAQANGNLLYVDEVNLLDDHLVDLLLDSAAMGVNYVEREGISYSHPSRFVLVGTMNPEEGDLRPQLLDRFGMSVDVKGDADFEKKKEIVRRRIEFDADPAAYLMAAAKETEELRRRIREARDKLPGIGVDDGSLSDVVNITLNFGIDGHRAEIAMIRAAKANAALDGRGKVARKDVLEVAPLVIAHRLRRRPFESTELNPGDIERCLS
ncbi:MAG: magnesium chelatase ATPase subunit I [Thermoplasmatales archaeon]|nr:magnesium chelatase ATPase subunit I [Thermoplasmatales archaeon]